MPSRILTDTTVKSAADAEERGLTTGVKRPAGKGQRLIMMAMGGINGFVKPSVKLWKRSAKDGVMSEDYHSDINAEGFEAWIREVLPLLPKNSVLVGFYLGLSILTRSRGLEYQRNENYLF